MNLISVKQAAKLYPFSEASLRWLLFHREQNGLGRACVKIGKRVLIDEDCFNQWLEAQREG